MDHPYSVSLFSTLFPGQITRLLTSLSNLLNAHMYSKKKSWTVKEKDVTFCVCMLSRFSCIWLWDTMDCSPPGSSVHGILQARILEWLPCPPPGDSPHPGTEPESLTSPVLAGRFFTTSATWEVQFSAVAQSCLTLCNPIDCSMLGLPLHHQLPEFTQAHVLWVGDTIQRFHPLSSPSLPILNLSQHQGLLKWVSFSHQVAKVLELQLQHQSFQWILRTDFL